jgi:signal peptidase I
VTTQRRRAPAVFLLAGLAAGLWFFAPAQLGGAASYTATVGTSMEPLFHKGDLAITKPASSYRVGDVVLYDSPVFNRPVLHRILVIQRGHYFFKGDNNDFVDPGYVTRDRLRGKLWLHVPNAGVALSWFGRPAHSAAIAGLAVLLLVLGGAQTAVRRRRRGRRRSRAAWKRPKVRTTFLRHLHRPRKSPENIAAGIAGVLAVVLLVVGFTHSTKRPAQLSGAYRDAGTFTYRAHVIHPVSTYPSGVAHAGEPLFLEDFETLRLGFAYRFASRLEHEVHGTIALKAVMSSDTNWQRTFVLAKRTGFAGDRARVDGNLDLNELRHLMLAVSTASGAVGANYTIDLQPVVRVRGKVGDKKLDETFSPSLPISLTQSVLKVTAPAPTSIPGATYTPPSPQSQLAAALNPTQAGSVAGVAPAQVKIVRLRLAVSTVRGLAIGLLLLTLLILFTKPMKRRREVWSLERRIAHRYGCIVVDVVSIADGALATGAPTRIPDFESLATLARYCERPILRESRDDGDAFAVEDGGRLYVFRAAPRPAVAAPVSEPVTTPRPPRAAPVTGPRRRIPSLVRFGAPTLLLVVAITSVAAFTGGNTVPVSHAGVSTKPSALSQIAPAACTMSLTNLVVATSASTSGSSGADLILGRSGAGSNSLSGGNGNDCIVAGGGAGTTNTIDGGPGTGDVCFGAAGATNTFSNCETTR